jgi:predicted XRE-type DNA-binding protein
LIEEWRDIKNYEGIYQVSNLGNVRSLDRVIEDSMGRKRKYKGKVLIPGNSKGYLKVDLKYKGSSKTMKIHRLVTQAFLDTYSENLPVNHKDGNKTNNNINNLECITDSENIKHCHKNGLHSSDKPVIAVCISTKEVLKFPSQREAARQLNISHSNINCILKNTMNSAKDFIFVYTEDKIKEKLKKAERNTNKKKVIAVNLETQEKLYFNSQREAGETLHINQNSISKIIKGDQRSSKGYKFIRTQ